MHRKQVFEIIQSVDDPVKDHGKILANLHYTHFHLMDRYKRTLERYNLTPIQSNVLGIIGYRHPDAISLEGIKALVLEPNSDVSRTVDRLKEKGFVKKAPDKDNRRKICINVTPKGLKIMTRINEEGLFKKFTAGMSLSEARAFVSALAKLRKA